MFVFSYIFANFITSLVIPNKHKRLKYNLVIGYSYKRLLQTIYFLLLRATTLRLLINNIIRYNDTCKCSKIRNLKTKKKQNNDAKQKRISNNKNRQTTKPSRVLGEICETEIV